MYCQNCGLELRDNAPSCPSCGQETRQPEIKYKSASALAFLTKPVIFLFIVLSLTAIVCYGLLGIYKKINLPDPALTVQKFYEAIENRDKDTALNCIFPDERDAGLGFNIELLLQPSVTIEYDGLKYKTVEKNKTSAKVRITGTAKLLIEGKAREIIFNDEAILKGANGTWYLDSTSLGDLFVL